MLFGQQIMFQLFREVEDIEFLKVKGEIIHGELPLCKLLFVFQNLSLGCSQPYLSI